MKILVTGSAGFIGYHTCKKLLEYKKYQVFGIDNLNNYYDIKIKKHRNNELKKNNNFEFKKLDICNEKKLLSFFKEKKIDVVINLAAQAGVRYSIQNPTAYFDSNVRGFFNILECSRKFKIKHLIFASTSSVYGNSKKFPVLENYNTDKPLSFYASTKKTNEVMAHSYSYLYKIPSTCLRFFTVYGPLGRPDMSLFKFVKKILDNKPIELYNFGKHERDFTHVDDIVKMICNLITKPPSNSPPFDIFNISGNKKTSLKKFINLIEKELKVKSKKKYLPMQTGDVLRSSASIDKIIKKTKLKPEITIDDGVKEFIFWYKEYYKQKL